jgi:hypothetical protein
MHIAEGDNGASYYMVCKRVMPPLQLALHHARTLTTFGATMNVKTLVSNLRVTWVRFSARRWWQSSSLRSSTMVGLIWCRDVCKQHTCGSISACGRCYAQELHNIAWARGTMGLCMRMAPRSARFRRCTTCAAIACERCASGSIQHPRYHRAACTPTLVRIGVATISKTERKKTPTCLH